MRPDREPPAEVPLDRDADRAGGRRPAERVAAPHLVSVDLGAERDVLPGQVVELAVQLGRNGEVTSMLSAVSGRTSATSSAWKRARRRVVVATGVLRAP